MGFLIFCTFFVVVKKAVQHPEPIPSKKTGFMAPFLQNLQNAGIKCKDNVKLQLKDINKSNEYKNSNNENLENKKLNNNKNNKNITAEFRFLCWRKKKQKSQPSRSANIGISFSINNFSYYTWPKLAMKPSTTAVLEWS